MEGCGDVMAQGKFNWTSCRKSREVYLNQLWFCGFKNFSHRLWDLSSDGGGDNGVSEFGSSVASTSGQGPAVFLVALLCHVPVDGVILTIVVCNSC